MPGVEFVLDRFRSVTSAHKERVVVSSNFTGLEPRNEVSVSRNLTGADVSRKLALQTIGESDARPYAGLQFRLEN